MAGITSRNKEIKFEGEYLNGKVWNGKVYNTNDNLEFYIINGNGNLIEYNDDGKKEFEGEYLNGKRNGKGKEYNAFILILRSLPNFFPFIIIFWEKFPSSPPYFTT